ncbi:RagB/SusD family nutrient uptake outer membrane protein [Parapedobacter sp. DT-150]|uniref:RagB/SusD family nutrient uptake outer membrane protein n=1 Tax=Parapedobacter sp. DT-150 TaxID=3396162 RepID=UPI003F1C80A6
MKKLIILVVAVISLGACSESFLDNVPEDTLTSGNFFKTESDFQQALIATYGAVRTAGDLNSWVMGEMRSDNTHYDINRGADASIGTMARLAVADFLDDDGNGVTNSKYDGSYVGISRANVILDRIIDVQMDAGKKDQIIAEAKFLRAFFYFELVRYYGGVPLYIHEVSNAEEASLQRATVDEVYAQIIADATEAAAILPPKARELGRASKAAAHMLLGYVYLTQKNYPAAEEVLRAVTGYGYSLLPDYRSVFDPTNKTNNELIFEVQYQDGPNGIPSDFIYRFLPLTDDASIVTGFSVKNITSGLNVPTQDLLESYEAGDTRLEASVAIAEGTGETGSSFIIESIKSPVNYSAPAGKEGKPFISKYSWPHAIVEETNSNWPIYRYADALLLLAEALNEQGGGKSAEALTYLNQVRNRAFDGEGTIAATDQATLRDIIAHERRIELAFENKRWLDLVRTDQAVDVMNAHGVEIKAADPNVSPSAYNVTAWRLIFPIPRREIQIGRLEQNPEY